MINREGRNILICGQCGESKLRSDFDPDNRVKSGLLTYCKKCRAKNRIHKRTLGQVSQYALRVKDPEVWLGEILKEVSVMN